MLETRAVTPGGAGTGALGVGGIAVACALAHVHVRSAGADWRAGRPALTARHAAVGGRPSMLATGSVEQS